MTRGDAGYRRALILRTIIAADGVTAKELAVAVQVAHSTVKPHLKALWDAGLVERELVVDAETGGRKYVYRSDVEPPPMPPRPSSRDPMVNRNAVLRAVADGNGGVSSRIVAEVTGLSLKAVQGYLGRLAKEKLIERDKRKGRTYLYRLHGAGHAVCVGEPGIVELPGDGDVDAAIERARPHWRIGELFPKEAKCQPDGLRAFSGRMVSA